MSISSRRTGRSDLPSAIGTPSHRSTRKHGPPSSFNLKYAASDVLREDGHDQTYLQTLTAEELRTEMRRVEAEGRRLLDAFNGLEMSARTKRRPSNNGELLGAGLQPKSATLERSPSTWTLVPDSGSKAGLPASSSMPMPSSSNDAADSRSVRSSVRRYRRAAPTESSKSPNGMLTSPVSPLSASRMVATRSTPNVAKTASSVDLTDDEQPDVDRELEEIQRKRAQVRLRIEEKLEYLRAMLRGAEIREKLAKQ